ncbi:hypothetical protein Hanom_Chr00s144013g01819861 [Helianthus anomalus]
MCRSCLFCSFDFIRHAILSYFFLIMLVLTMSIQRESHPLGTWINHKGKVFGMMLSFGNIIIKID